MSNTRLKRFLVWGYLVEALAASVLTAMLYVAVKNNILRIEQVVMAMNWCHDICTRVLTAGAISWVVILVLPFGLMTFLGDEFKAMLLAAGAVTEYVKANIVAAASFCLAFVLITKCDGKTFDLIVTATIFINLYALINIFTVSKNAVDLLWLAQKYRQLKGAQK